MEKGEAIKVVSSQRLQFNQLAFRCICHCQFHVFVLLGWATCCVRRVNASRMRGILLWALSIYYIHI